MCFNVTIYNQSEIYMKNRQLHFAFLHHIQQIDELVATVQYVVIGKLPINVIDPQYIVKHPKECNLAVTREL